MKPISPGFNWPPRKSMRTPSTRPGGCSMNAGPRKAKQDLRGWEWARLMHLCRQSERTWKMAAPAEAVAFSPDGSRFVTAAWDGHARVWDFETGKELHDLKHRRPIRPCREIFAGWKTHRHRQQRPDRLCAVVECRDRRAGEIVLRPHRCRAQRAVLERRPPARHDLLRQHRPLVGCPNRQGNPAV